MENVFKKLIELKVISLIVLLIVGSLAGYLLTHSRDNPGALVGGYCCLGLFGLISMFLLIYSVVKEHFEAVLDNVRKSGKDIENSYKDLVDSSSSTNRALEKERRKSLTRTSGDVESSVFKEYRKTESSGTSAG